MGARKKKTVATSAVPPAREFTIVLEDLRAQFRVFGEALGGISARIDGMDARFDRMDARFDRMGARFDGMDARFDRMDACLDSAVLDSNREIRDLRVAIARKVERDEVVRIVDEALARRHGA